MINCIHTILISSQDGETIERVLCSLTGKKKGVAFSISACPMDIQCPHYEVFERYDLSACYRLCIAIAHGGNIGPGHWLYEHVREI